MSDPVGRTVAARDNAALCDAVVRTHGIHGRTDAIAWTSAVRTPDLYPDAVTLVPDVDERALLDRIDASPGASVKDSFSSLDLHAHGFRVLFDATWFMVRLDEPAALDPDPDGWRIVDDTTTFEAWEAAWRAHGGAPGVLLPALVDEPEVWVVAGGADDHVEAGALLTRSTDMIGVSNVFGPDRLAAFSRALDVAAWRHGAAAVIGYGADDELTVARALGARPLGPLRVWIR